MSAVNKIVAASDISSCRSLHEFPYDLGKGEFRQNQLENIKSAGAWGGPRVGSGRPPGSLNKPKQRLIQRAIGPRWYVFEMMRGQEDRIVRELLEGEDQRGYIARPSFEICQPRIVVEIIRKGKRIAVHQNMFAGYAFCHLSHLSDPWPLIREVEGVLRIFTTRSINPDTGNVTPIPLPVDFVENLIETAPQRLHLAAIRLPSYAPSQVLRVESGPFADHPAVCLSCDGLTTRVSVHLFGRDVEITLPRSELSAVSVAP